MTNQQNSINSITATRNDTTRLKETIDTAKHIELNQENETQMKSKSKFPNEIQNPTKMKQL